MSLFRKEVLDHRRERLHGDVHLAVPVSWQIVGGLFFVIVVAAATFLSLASYSRIETVVGVITPEAGVAEIIPTRAGTITGLFVETGEIVKPGRALAVVRIGESLVEGETSSAQILASLERQEEGLQSQAQQIAASAAAERAQLTQHLAKPL